MQDAQLFNVLAVTTFEPAGEACGTVYDWSHACPICSVGRELVGLLHLQKSRIPKKDISRTIAGEHIVSLRFKQIAEKWGIKGMDFLNIVSGKHSIDTFFHIRASNCIKLSSQSVIQDNLISKTAFSEPTVSTIQGYRFYSEKEVYICPEGHLLGLNFISEPYVENNKIIGELDFLRSEQSTGVKRGYLYPEPIQLCSPTFRQMVIEEKLTGFSFEVAHIVE